MKVGTVILRLLSMDPEQKVEEEKKAVNQKQLDQLDHELDTLLERIEKLAPSVEARTTTSIGIANRLPLEEIVQELHEPTGRFRKPSPSHSGR